MKILNSKNNEKEMKTLMGFEPAHNKRNGLTAGSDSTY